MNKVILVSLVLIVTAFIVGLYLYPYMPQTMASHWDMDGNVNGYIPRIWGVFLIPIIVLFLFLLFLTIPKIDPLARNIAKFRRYYDAFIITFVAFMLYVQSFTLLWNLGYVFNISYVIIPALSVLFFFLGVLLGKTKRNWFIGIRTPWTISSDKVWNKTNEVGSKMFKAVAVIALLGLVFGDLALYFVIIPVVFVTIYTVIYSYFEYQRQCK